MIQLCGAVLLVSTNAQTEKTGLHIYTGGVALQQFFILCFISLVSTFHRRLLKASDVSNIFDGMKLLYALYISLGLITVNLPYNPPQGPIKPHNSNTRTHQFRIIFRIIEFSAGLGTQLTAVISEHEAFTYCFDAVPMFFALLTFNILHPGLILVGPTSDSSKQMRAGKKRLRRWRERKAKLNER